MQIDLAVGNVMAHVRKEPPEAAREADVPMPFLSVLLDRYTSAKARGRADFDWSAIGLSVAEDAGIDVSEDVARTRKDVDEGNLY